MSSRRNFSEMERMGSNESFANEMQPEIGRWYWPLLWTIAGITAIDNFIVILLVAWRKRLHTKTNWFILSLSCADFIIGAVVTPMEYMIDYVLPEDQISDVLAVVCDIFFDISAVNLCMVTFDRYLAVAYPLKYVTFLTHRRVCGLIFLAWLIPLLFSVIRIFISFHIGTEISEQISSYAVIVLFQFLPIVYLTVSFAHIACVVRKHMRKINKDNQQLKFNHQREPIRHTGRYQLILPLMGTINGTFVICYGINIYDFISTSHFDLEMPFTYIGINNILINFNSLVNPIMYGILKSDFKREVKRFFCLQCVRVGLSKSTSFELTNVNSSRK